MAASPGISIAIVGSGGAGALTTGNSLLEAAGAEVVAGECRTEDHVIAAARDANADEFIRGFPQGYDTIVGEKGVTLSGGQKQRTALARAVVRDPRILILDDALSSVDTHTEDKILNHLREIMQGRTTIVIAHRLSTIERANRIAVLAWKRHDRGVPGMRADHVGVERLRQQSPRTLGSDEQHAARSGGQRSNPDLRF